MDNNNYQPVYEQPQQTQQPQFEQPVYQQPAQPNILPPDIQQRIDGVFGKALASTIMSEFPIASIIAIFFGNNALKEIMELMDICRTMGMRLPGKLVAARILGIVGKISGIVCTCIYAGLAVFYAFYFILFFGMFAMSGF
ncbi:MAG: hypothetical protein IKT55_06020 [Clostridia bacterium]|nr:hypothetical protein [Clostridia bacterium]